MRKIEPTTAFKREGKGQHRAVLDTDLKQVITALANDVPLSAKHRDHTLAGNWKDYVNQRAIFASDQHEPLPIVLMLGSIVCGSLSISTC